MVQALHRKAKTNPLRTPGSELMQSILNEAILLKKGPTGQKTGQVIIQVVNKPTLYSDYSAFGGKTTRKQTHISLPV